MFKKENHNLARINKRLVYHINHWILLHQDIDPRLITMSIQHIETSKDLSQTKLFIRHEDSPESLAKTLNQHHHPLHQYLFKNLDIRRIPKVKFRVQEKSETNIFDILDEIDNG